VDTLKFTIAEARDLRPATWLRDGVINVFFMILRLRGEAALAAAGAPNGHAAGLCWPHNSFFYAKLVGQVGAPKYSYDGVRRWTGKNKKYPAGTDIFAYRWVVMPVNRGNMHWALGVIDNVMRTVAYYDSLNGKGSDVTTNLVRLVGDEWADKKGAPLPSPYTVAAAPSTLPQQTNGNDCGAFVCGFAWCFSLGQVPSPSIFGQRDISLLRRKIAAVCLAGGL
jgi:Ulp1 family protease